MNFRFKYQNVNMRKLRLTWSTSYAFVASSLAQHVVRSLVATNKSLREKTVHLCRISGADLRGFSFQNLVLSNNSTHAVD